jgi:fibronectin type 3 domain-containing protein
MASGAAAFTLLNSTVDTATSYVDSSVSAGTAYIYEIKSVDAAGVESSASNEYTVTIP